MKQISKSSSKKKIWSSIVISLMILMVAAAYVFYWRKPATISNVSVNRPENSVDYSPPSQKALSNNEKRKKEVIDQGSATSDTSLSYNLTISRVSQQPNEPLVNIRTILEGTTTGTCHALFANGSESFSRTFPVAMGATYATCNTDISVFEFPNSGNWTLSIYAETENAKSNIAAGNVVVSK